jgi:hypothetical protein
MTPIRPLSIGDTERLVQRWSDLPASMLRVATLFTFVVPCPGLTTVCGTDVPVPASAALDECVQRIQDKVTQVRMAHPDCGLRLLPVERFSQACLSGHLRTGTLAAKAVCHSYLKTRHEQAEKDPRIDVEVETLPRYTGDVQPTAMPYEFYWSVHFKRAAGRLFSVRNALLERLDWTDIEVGLPLAKLGFRSR